MVKMFLFYYYYYSCKFPLKKHQMCALHGVETGRTYSKDHSVHLVYLLCAVVLAVIIFSVRYVACADYALEDGTRRSKGISRIAS